METFLIVVCGLALYLVVITVARWAVRRDIARCAQRREEQERETLLSYKRNTIPGRRAASVPDKGSVRQVVKQDDAPTSPWDIPAMGMLPTEPARHDSAPHVYSSPALVGGGGQFSGGGATGGWEPSGCGGGDYSGGSDSSTACSASAPSGSD